MRLSENRVELSRKNQACTGMGRSSTNSALTKRPKSPPGFLLTTMVILERADQFVNVSVVEVQALKVVTRCIENRRGSATNGLAFRSRRGVSLFCGPSR
jgi:hypothetical protein